MISSYEDLKKSYNALKSKKLWRTFAIEGIVLIIMFGMAPLIIIGTSIEPFEPAYLIGGIIGLIVFLIIIRKMLILRKTPPLKNHQIIFLVFFEAYDGLHDLKQSYRAKQEELYEEYKKKAISSIKSFSYDVGLWKSSNAPTGLVTVQSEIKDIIDENIIPMIKSNDKEKFTSFSNYFLEICDSLHKNDLTYDDWVKFKNKLKELGIERETQPEIKDEVKVPDRKLYLLRKEVLGSITWILSSIGFYVYEPNLILAIATGGPIAGAVTYIFAKQYPKSEMMNESNSN